VIVLVLILILELYLLNRILKYFLLSPIYLYVIFSLVSLILSIGYYYYFENKFSLFNIDNVSEDAFLSAIKMYIIALISFLTGVILYYDLLIKEQKKQYNKSYTNSLFFKYKVPNKTTIVAKGLFFLIILLFFITYGKEIFLRAEYLPETNRGLIIIIKILSFIEVIILGIIHRKHKLLSNTYFILLILISLGTGSRSVFLFFLIYISLLFISQGNTLVNKVKFSFHIFLSFVFLAYIMQLRGLDSHGIIPYLKSIVIFKGEFIRSFLFNIYYSLIYGVFVTIKTIQNSQLDWNIIFINLNPLPGSIAGWYDHAKDMRINTYVPYSLHGRVFKTGTIFTIVYFFTTGLIFSYMEKKVRSFLNKDKRLLAFTIVLILILHIVYGFEYNMRAAIRYIYYAFFIIVLAEGIKYIKFYLPKKKKHNEY